MKICNDCKHRLFCYGKIIGDLVLKTSKEPLEQVNKAFNKENGLECLHFDIVCDRYEPYSLSHTNQPKPSVKILPVPFIFIDERGKNS